jgi:hypothetical protein
MGKTVAFLGGVGFGAALMFGLDPSRGRARRAKLRDRVRHEMNQTEDAILTAARDTEHRAYGLLAELRGRMSESNVPDDVLAERVRSRLGRLCTHPRAIEVAARDGVVTLVGPVLSREMPRVIDGVKAVRGVRNLVSRLAMHERPDLLSLQGDSGRGARFDHWPPEARLMALLVGGSLATVGLARRGLLGTALGGMGLAGLIRGLTDRPPRELAAMVAGVRGPMAQA